jgi:hypothetical protein
MTSAIKSGMTIQADPAVLEVDVGGIAKSDIKVEAPEGYQIYLTIRGVPEKVLGIFDPSMGFDSFGSELTIVASKGAHPGLYELTITANAHEHGVKETTKLALTVKGQTDGSGDDDDGAPQTNTENLQIHVETDKLDYSQGETVNILGDFKDDSLNAVQDASVSIQVVDGSGKNVHIYQTTTNAEGLFEDSFALAGDAPDGTYTVYVSISYEGKMFTTSSTFAVGQSSTPTVSILSLNIETTGGNPDSQINPGSELNVSVLVSNTGADLSGGIIWLEIDNPNDVPVYLFMTSLPISGEVFTYWIFTLDANSIGGAYTANAYVSNGIISEGGVFLDSEYKMFTVASSTEPPSDAMPEVSIVHPALGENVSGEYRINVTATDAEGLSTVSLKINDGDPIDITGSFDPVTNYCYYIWDTTGLADGDYTLAATATDSAAQSASTSLTVTVDNTV